MRMLDVTAVDFERQTRETSSIAFPYGDLAEAVSVAKGMLAGGGVALSRDQLAAAMNQSPNSGNFSGKLGTARMFGLLETVQGKYQLTPLGFEILDPDREKRAMAEAFLSVPLYRRTYDEFRGKQLPPRPHGLETAFVNFGVSSKQKDKARHAFDRSARMAGFFPNGNEDRLVEPLLGGNLQGRVVATDTASVSTASGAAEAASDSLGGLKLHRSIRGMLEELPEPKSEWSVEDQADWLQALATMFRVIYKTTGTGQVTVTSGS